jgi:glycosyltransferase involved in cell wall biosynthesis
MKILIVSQYFYPEDFKVNDIAFDFVKRGHEVTVFTAKPNYPQGKFYKGYSFFGKSNEIINGVKVIRIPIFPRLNGTGKFLIINYLSFIFFSFLFKYRVKGNFDVVFSHLPSPLIAALPAIWFKNKFKSKLYLWVLDLWPESIQANSKIKDGFIINNLNRLIKYIYNNTDVILISSRVFKNSILDKGINPDKIIKYFPNWAEDVFINEIIDFADMPILPEGFNVMFAGNIGDSQDFESILEAAKLTKGKGINWILVGDGRKVSWIKEEIEKHSMINVYLLGRYPLDMMPSLFKEADAMLVSLKDSPTFSLTVPAKVQAYMASSKIILGMFNGEGQLLINESGSGYAVDAGKFSELCEKIQTIKSLSKEQRFEMEKSSKNYYLDNFSKKQLFDLLETDFKN